MSDRADEYDDVDNWEDELDDSVTDVADVNLDEELTDYNSAPQIGALPDGSGSVILSGPGAGTAVESTPTERSNAQYRLRTRDEALTTGVPIFIVHRPHQNVALMPRLLASVVAVTRGAVSTAASVGLPQATDDSLTAWLASCPVASIRLADPFAYLQDRTVVRVPEVSDRARKWRPYLGTTSVDVTELLDLQRGVGANLLLSSGRALDYTTPQPALDQAFTEGDDSLAELLPNERLALNLTLPAAWLANATLRGKLFSQLVDQEQFDVWHIRVQWPASLRSLHQPVDAELLSGYKRLSQLAADEDRVLLLPQTGLTGWVQLAFGAHGFGSGLFGSAQAFKEHSRGGNGHQSEIERYFEPSLLHPVERAVHDAMRVQSGYIQCDCPYCPALHAKTQWDHTLARLHLMHWQGRLAGLASATGKTQEVAVRKVVRAAVQAANNQPLAGISVPRHLSAWDQLL